MLVAYVDEADDGKGTYWIAAVICSHNALAHITTGLDSIMAQVAVAGRGVPYTAELHAYDLMGGSGLWKPAKAQLPWRIGVAQAVLTTIRDSGATIIYYGVRAAKLTHRTPHSLALEYLLERVDKFAEQHDTGVMVIADQVSGEHAHRRDLWSWQLTSTGGYKPRRLSRVMDTMFFTESHASRGVQAADFVAYFHQRRFRDLLEPQVRHPKARRTAAQLWRIVEPNVLHNFDDLRRASGYWDPS